MPGEWPLNVKSTCFLSKHGANYVLYSISAFNFVNTLCKHVVCPKSVALCRVSKIPSNANVPFQNNMNGVFECLVEIILLMATQMSIIV